jgi:uncharacterized membrane protein
MKKLCAVIVTLISVATPTKAAPLPSFWCSFTEPFISVSTGQNGIYFDDNDQHKGFALRPLLQKQGSNQIISGLLKDGKTFSLKISAGPGSDGMSEYDYPYEGRLSGAASVVGGCVKMPGGSMLRRVVGVAENDQLNLRDRPNSSGKRLGFAYPNSFVWLRSRKLKNSWAEVSAVSRPKSEQGAVISVSGWVNAKFLTIPH